MLIVLLGKKVLAIKGYDKLNIKYLLGFICLTLLGFICMAITIISVSNEYEFYKNSEHASAKFVSKLTDEHDTSVVTIRYQYVVGDKDYYYDFECSASSAEAYNENDVINIFYNKNNPQDCRRNKKSLVSVYMIVVIFLLMGLYGLIMCIKHLLTIGFNKKLIKKNNYIMADYNKIMKRKSYSNTNKGIENYVLCKSTINNQEYIFKSMVMYSDVGHYLKGKKVKVYVDPKNYKRYLVDINDINSKVNTK